MSTITNRQKPKSPASPGEQSRSTLATAEVSSQRAEAAVRFGAWLGIVSAAILVFNGFKRAGIVADVAVVQLIAPFGVALAFGLLVAIWVRGGIRQAWALALAALGLALTTGGEFVLNFVFPYSTDEARSALLAGPLTIALTIMAATFLLGLIAFTATQWNASPDLRLALVVMVLGAVPIALRSALPPIAVPIGVWLLAIAQVWIAVVLLRSRR